MASTKIIQSMRDNNPNYVIDKIIQYIIETGDSYPNNDSVINDHMRFQLQKLFGINLSMFDTHSFCIGSYTGVCFDRVYYVYEAPIEKINKLVGSYTSYIIPVINYPEGVLLGFFPSEFKDVEYRKSHSIEYAIVIYNLYMNFYAYCNDAASAEINDLYYTIFRLNLFAMVADDWDKIEWNSDDDSLFHHNNYDGDIYASLSHLTGYAFTEEDIISHAKEIQSVYRSYNYAEVGELFRKYGTKAQHDYDEILNSFLKPIPNNRLKAAAKKRKEYN